MSKIYTQQGWVNWDYLYSQTNAFCMVTGARGTGKTYGLFRYLVTNGIKFIYLRRLKTQLDECGTMESNPFKKLNSDLSLSILPFRSKTSIQFYHTIPNEDGRPIPQGDPVAIGLALSTFATVRGADFSDIPVIVFDEAIPMETEKTVKNEFDAFLNFYQTVNRNRQLQGKEPVKAFLLGNANKLANPYFIGWNFMRTALNMINGKQMVWRSRDKSRLMVMLLESPISKRKADTTLYKNGSKEFASMALDNAFRTDETQIKSFPLNECQHIVSIGQIGIYRHKGDGKHFISKVVNKQNYYDPYGIKLTMFRNDYALLKLMYLNNCIWFETFEEQLIFREYIGIN